jgi:hypothetical protein
MEIPFFVFCCVVTKALGAQMQEDVSSYEFLPDVVIVRQSERMAQEARGHGGSSSWFSLA